ncbi:hypothetical protein V6S67_10605 [Arthrobacter sp. Soc17.1.1.1]|uniref:hypothetical protein n=1 Tax=Arthrobacter sp. Soc17.1.1.1 TaxID=3121277 RepID=UPI002FE433AD
MRSSTRSLLIALGTAAVIVVQPLLMDPGSRAAQDVPVVAAAEAPVPAAEPVTVRDGVQDGVQDGSGASRPGAPAASADAPPSPAPPPSGSGMGGDLPPGDLPTPPYPQCPITEAGAWWTDPGDPYTCIPPGSRPFHEPTPPGIDPGLLEPIFEEPGTAPAPGDDCRTTGALRCTVTIMGQDYVVTFADGKPVGVVEMQG